MKEQEKAVCYMALMRTGNYTPPSEEQISLVKILKYLPMRDYHEAMKVIDAMFLANGLEPIDSAELIWSLYGAGVIAGIRQEREKNHKNKMSAHATDQD